MTPFYFLPFGRGQSITIIQCLSHLCNLKADDLSCFTDPQMERNFAPGILPILDLEDLGDEILDF